MQRDYVIVAECTQDVHFPLDVVQSYPSNPASWSTTASSPSSFANIFGSKFISRCAVTTSTDNCKLPAVTYKMKFVQNFCTLEISLFCVVLWHQVSLRTFGVTYGHILSYACKSPKQTLGQTRQVGCQPGDWRWALNLPQGFVWAYMGKNTLSPPWVLQGPCCWTWTILTLC